MSIIWSVAVKEKKKKVWHILYSIRKADFIILLKSGWGTGCFKKTLIMNFVGEQEDMSLSIWMQEETKTKRWHTAKDGSSNLEAVIANKGKCKKGVDQQEKNSFFYHQADLFSWQILQGCSTEWLNGSFHHCWPMKQSDREWKNLLFSQNLWKDHS